jgi:hypothetical protein
VAFRRYCFGATPKTRLKAFLSNDSRQKHKKLARQKKKRRPKLTGRFTGSRLFLPEKAGVGGSTPSLATTFQSR